MGLRGAMEIRVKFIKKHKQYQPGQIATIPQEDALNLVDKGIAVISKDMTVEDVSVG